MTNKYFENSSGMFKSFILYYVFGIALIRRLT